MQKKERIQNPKLLEQVRRKPCVVCKKVPSDPHHVTTRGAGGDDVPDNLMPLCHRHHVEWHQIGPSKMVMQYAGVHYWLVANGREDVLSRTRRARLGEPDDPVAAEILRATEKTD